MLYIVNLSLSWGTVCVCRPTFEKVHIIMFCYSYSITLAKLRHPLIFEPDDIWKSYILQKKPWIEMQDGAYVLGFLLRYITYSYGIRLKKG